MAGVRFRFEGGKVVDASAEKGEEFLIEMLDTDDGARRLGELGIGTNYGITAGTGEILLDEKIGGTVHLAVGRSYPETGGVNESAIHWDMICDLRKGGQIEVDGETLQRDGKFVVVVDSRKPIGIGSACHHRGSEDWRLLMAGRNLTRRLAAAFGLAGALCLLWSGVASATTKTFTFTGAEQTFVVPTGITKLHVDAVGGRGGDGMADSGGPFGVGGLGAHASGDVGVTANEVLFVLVGGNGTAATANAGGAGGFNGGGIGGSSGGDPCNGAGGGGGASDVRTTLSSLASRLVIAAGGGGGGGSVNGGGVGGGGGGGAAQNGSDGSGTGAGVHGAAATANFPGGNGSQGQGGGGGSSASLVCGGGGGGGGGGAFGGGGAANGSGGSASAAAVVAVQAPSR